MVTGPSDGCHPLMLPSPTIFRNSLQLTTFRIPKCREVFVKLMQPKLRFPERRGSLVRTSREVSDFWLLRIVLTDREQAHSPASPGV